MIKFTLNQLVNARLYVGTSKTNYRRESLKYVIGFRKNVGIIDLVKTMYLLKRGLFIVHDILYRKKKILLVSSEKMHGGFLSKFSRLCDNQFYVAGDWIGGTLTNFRKIRKVIKPTTKPRMLASLVLPLGRFTDNFVLKEALSLGLPTIAFVDTAMMYEGKYDYVVPLNANSEKSVHFICLLLRQVFLFSRYNLMKDLFGLKMLWKLKRRGKRRGRAGKRHFVKSKKILAGNSRVKLNV